MPTPINFEKLAELTVDKLKIGHNSDFTEITSIGMEGGKEAKYSSFHGYQILNDLFKEFSGNSADMVIGDVRNLESNILRMLLLKTKEEIWNKVIDEVRKIGGGTELKFLYERTVRVEYPNNAIKICLSGIQKDGVEISWHEKYVKTTKVQTVGMHDADIDIKRHQKFIDYKDLPLPTLELLVKLVGSETDINNKVSDILNSENATGIDVYLEFKPELVIHTSKIDVKNRKNIPPKACKLVF